MDPGAILTAARSFLRPIGWRGTTPIESGLQGCLLFQRERRATSFDGTEIAYSVFGRSGPWVALVPGFCCPDNFWRYLLPELQKRYRVIVYDLRGLGMSGNPRAPGWRSRNLSAGDFSMENHAQDLQAVLDREKVNRVALVGHSMGGQIILETYREYPERISALVMLTAPFESPTRTLYGRDLDALLQFFKTAINLFPRPAVLLWRSLFLANPSLTHKGAQLVRALGPLAKAEDMVTYYRHMAFLDPILLMKMAEAMRAHSAADVLPTVKVPTLIVAGTLDPFTPPVLAERMHREIADSEVVYLEGASHGAVIEKPDEVNEGVTKFLGRHLRAEVSRGAATSTTPY